MGLNLSFEETRDLIHATLNANRTGEQRRAWIRSIYSDRVVYEDESAGTGLFQRTYTLGDDGKVTFGDPQKVIAKRDYAVVKMSSDGQWTKVFEAGDYPDKGIAFTAEEVAAMAAVGSLPVNHGHPSVNGPFDGKFGEVELKAGEPGVLLGRWKAPKWIAGLLASDGESGVSLEIDRTTKLPDFASLVTSPRVTGAKLQAAFSADSEPRKEGTVSKLATSILALFGAAKAEGLISEDAGGGDFPTKTDFSESAEAKRLRDENAALKAEQSSLREGQIATLAAQFADNAVADGRALPAEKPKLVALFTHALRDDVAGKALFASDGKPFEGERVRALRDLIADRPQNKLTQEQLAATTVFTNGGGDKEKTYDFSKAYEPYNEGGKR